MIEILSDSTAQRDRGAKQQLYAHYGVAHYWIVDAAARSLTEHMLKDGAYAIRATHLAGRPASTALFPELPIDLAEILG